MLRIQRRHCPFQTGSYQKSFMRPRGQAARCEQSIQRRTELRFEAATSPSITTPVKKPFTAIGRRRWTTEARWYWQCDETR